MRWIAALIWRLPPRSRRWRWVRAGAGGDRCDSGGSSELGVAWRSDRRRRSRRRAWRRSTAPTPGSVEQLRRDRADESVISRLERVDRRASARAGGAARRGDPHAHRLLGARQATRDARAPLAYNSELPGRLSSSQRSCRFHCSVLLSATRFRSSRSRWSTSSRRSSSRPSSAPSGSVRCRPRRAARATDSASMLIRLAALAAGACASRHQPASTRAQRARRARSETAPSTPRRAGSPPAPKHARHRGCAPRPAAPKSRARRPATVLSSSSSPVAALTAATVCEPLVGVRAEHDH